MKLICMKCDAGYNKGDFKNLTFVNQQIKCLNGDCTGHLVRLGINNEYYWFVENLLDEKRYAANVTHSIHPKNKTEQIGLTFRHVNSIPSIPNGFACDTANLEHVFRIEKTYSTDLTLFEREKILLQTMIDLIDWAVSLP